MRRATQQWVNPKSILIPQRANATAGALPPFVLHAYYSSTLWPGAEGTGLCTAPHLPSGESSITDSFRRAQSGRLETLGVLSAETAM